MADTKIEWTRGDDGTTGSVWNPVRGCSRTSPGCLNCYAERQAHRFAGPGGPYGGLTTLRGGRPGWTGEVRFIPEMLDVPLHWKRPRRIFVNSMSDLFHPKVTDGQILDVWRIMGLCQQHRFQVVTKRPQRKLEFLREWSDVEPYDVDPVLAHGPAAVRAAHTSGRARLFADMIQGWGTPPDGAAYPTYDWARGMRWWPQVLPNVWLGVSVEDQERADERIPPLLEAPAAVRFVSCEPLLEAMDLARWMWPTHWSWDARYRTPEEAIAAGARAEKHRQHLVNAGSRFIDWVIVGAESGPRARPCSDDWVRAIRDQCRSAGVPCFVKQLARPGTRRGVVTEIDDFPADLRVREFPSGGRKEERRDGN